MHEGVPYFVPLLGEVLQVLNYFRPKPFRADIQSLTSAVLCTALQSLRCMIFSMHLTLNKILSPCFRDPAVGATVVIVLE